VSAGVAAAPLGRLVRSVDFQRVLQKRSYSRSAHFAAHHLAEPPSLPARGRTLRRHLSTVPGVDVHAAVDTSPAAELEGAPAGSRLSAAPRIWLGAVVPKRHAKRAVTRTLLKRQIRSVFAAGSAGLPGGLWVVRLRAGFDRSLFVSAASAALRAVARDELQQLLQRCRVAPC